MLADQVAPDRNRRQRQRALHSRFPHATEIFEQRQTLRLIRKSSLVDQHAAIHVPAQHGLLDPIEPHRHGVEPARADSAAAQPSCARLEWQCGHRRGASCARRRSGRRRIRRRRRSAEAHNDRVCGRMPRSRSSSRPPHRVRRAHSAPRRRRYGERRAVRGPDRAPARERRRCRWGRARSRSSAARDPCQHGFLCRDGGLFQFPGCSVAIRDDVADAAHFADRHVVQVCDVGDSGSLHALHGAGGARLELPCGARRCRCNTTPSQREHAARRERAASEVR